MLQRRRQWALVLLDRPCLLSLAVELPVRLGEVGPVIGTRGRFSYNNLSSSGRRTFDNKPAEEAELSL